MCGKDCVPSTHSAPIIDIFCKMASIQDPGVWWTMLVYLISLKGKTPSVVALIGVKTPCEEKANIIREFCDPTWPALTSSTPTWAGGRLAWWTGMRWSMTLWGWGSSTWTKPRLRGNCSGTRTNTIQISIRYYCETGETTSLGFRWNRVHSH